MRRTGPTDRTRRELLKNSSRAALAALLPLGGSRAARATGAAKPLSPGSAAAAPPQPRPLMQPNLAHSLDERCRSKAVLGEMVIDDMELDGAWSASTVVRLGYTAERAKAGTRSLRFETLARNEEYIKQSRAKNGSFTGSDVPFPGAPFAASASLRFATPQDWSAYNRISLWCYLHPTRNILSSLSLQFLCRGASAGPADPIAVHYIGDLRPGEWNQLTWEISEYPRDQVTEFVLFKPVSGLPFRDAEPTITYDFDQLSVQRVEVEPVQGWQVTPRKVAYAHFGYRPTSAKVAICADTGAEGFSLIDADSGAVAARFAAATLSNARGRFQILDFSSHAAAGRYRLQCGDAQSEAFPIGENVWDHLIDCVLNGFYGLRCGCAVPGVHDACHLDVQVAYRGERRVVGGGWHDAANLTQGPGRTHLSIYALLRLYEGLAGRTDQAQRAARALEEARWGLAWSLRLRFGPGLRCLYGVYSYWTDGKPGTDDDVLQENVGRDTFQNILAVLACATCARVLKSADPLLSAQALRAAREDYTDAASEFQQPPGDAAETPINQGSWRDRIGYLTLAAVELFRVTHDAAYRQDAVRFGVWLVALQEQQFVGGNPITGYFYEDAARTRLVHEFHNGFDECGLLALQALCDTFTDDPAWMNWYAAALMYSEYFCARGSAASAPFNVVPAAVWRRADIEAPQPEDRLGASLAAHPSPLFPTPPDEALVRAQMRSMFDAGTELTPELRLRVFPLWHNHIQHGATTVQMGKSAGLAGAAQLRGRVDLAELAARQLEWVVGANPFSRSLIYGVGYDFWQNFTVSLPNLVGGISLGFNSYSGDAPAWGNNAVFPYKEIWVFASCRVALNLAHVGVPARIDGAAVAAVEFQHQRTGHATRIPAGRFSLHLPAGRYTVRCGGFEWRTLDLVDGRRYRFVFNPRQAIEIAASSTIDEDDHVTLTLRIRGRGDHRIELRLFNCETDRPIERVRLVQDDTYDMVRQLRIIDKSKPWVTVAIPEGQYDWRQEACGHSRSVRGAVTIERSL